MPTDDYEDDDRPRRPRRDDDFDDAPRRSRGGKPHHGVVILVLGILGLCCGLSGLVAFIWGLIEIGKMNKGEIDSSGKGLVTAGLIIGILGFVLNFGAGIYMNMHPNAFK
jgi:hypothetical protein